MGRGLEEQRFIKVELVCCVLTELFTIRMHLLTDCEILKSKKRLGI